MADTHKVTKTNVVQLENGEYGIEFEFDDGYTDFAEVGCKETAEFYATVQMGEDIVVGVNPLLLNAAKAETLRRNGSDRAIRNEICDDPVLDCFSVERL